MSPKIPATPRCAAHSCSRIELASSPRIVWVWIAWLNAFCAMALGGVALPLLVRVVICVAAAAASAASIRSMILLRAPRGVRSLQWSPQAGLQMTQGSSGPPVPVELAVGSFRFGTGVLVLWLKTPAGLHGVFIDGYRQEPGAFRGLCRRLEWQPRSASGRPQRPTDTIGPKV
jgi:hypothetical protein